MSRTIRIALLVTVLVPIVIVFAGTSQAGKLKKLQDLSVTATLVDTDRISSCATPVGPAFPEGKVFAMRDLRCVVTGVGNNYPRASDVSYHVSIANAASCVGSGGYLGAFTSATGLHYAPNLPVPLVAEMSVSFYRALPSEPTDVQVRCEISGTFERAP